MFLKRNMHRDLSTDSGSGGEQKVDPAVVANQKVEKLEGTVNEMVSILQTLANTPPDPVKADDQKKAIEDKNLDAKGQDGKPLFNDEQREFIRKEFKNVLTQESQETKRNQLLYQYDAKAEGKFPELKDKNSELYKRTQRIITDLKSVDPHAGTRPDLVWSAAHTAEEEIRYERAQKNSGRTRAAGGSGFMTSNAFLEGGSGGSSRRNDTSRNYNDNEDVSETRLAVRNLLGVKPRK